MKRIKLYILSIFIVSLSLSWAKEDNKIVIEPRGRTIFKRSGEYFEVSCICEASHPEIIDHITWVGPRGGVLDSGYNNVQVQLNPPNNLNLIFLKSTSGDTGEYSCFASFAGIYKENFVNIIFYDFSFEDCPTRQVLIVNKDAKITCRVKADPPAIATWSKNNVNIDTNRYTVLSDGIGIVKVAEEDGGTFTFAAIVPSTGHLHTIDLKVEVHFPPKITQFDEIYQFVAGERVELYCKATGNPPAKYYWTNQQQNLSQVIGYIVNSVTGLLTIKKIEREDAGNFKCLAVNIIGSAYSVAQVSVVVKPEVNNFQNETVVYGRDIVLSCRVTGDPKPTFSKRKDGKDERFEFSDDKFTLETKPKGLDQLLSLTIKSAKRSDAGIYYCGGQNEGGRVEKAGYLQVEFPPELSLSTTRWKRTWRGQPVNLSCTAEAIPYANFTWFFKGIPIVSNEIYHIYGEASYSNLLVRPLSIITGGIEIFGKYICEATNKYGKDSIEIELSEVRTPGIIQQCTVTSNTATTITFSLQGPRDDGGLHIRELLVEYHENGDEATVVRRRAWIGSGTYILRDLKPLTAYVFRFATINDVGIGEFSEDKKFFPPMEFSPDTPSFTILSGTNISQFPDSYQVWFSVPDDNGNEIEFFELRLLEVELEGIKYHQVGNDKRYTIDKWENTTSFNITTLRPNTLYEVEIRAKNKIGYSLPGSMLFKTPEGWNIDAQKLEYNNASLPTASMIAFVIMIVVLLVIFGLIDGICYVTSQYGIFYYLITSVCGRLGSAETMKARVMEDGKREQKKHPKWSKSKTNELNSIEETPMVEGTIDSTDNKRVNEDNKNYLPKKPKKIFTLRPLQGKITQNRELTSI